MRSMEPRIARCSTTCLTEIIDANSGPLITLIICWSCSRVGTDHWSTTLVGFGRFRPWVSVLDRVAWPSFWTENVTNYGEWKLIFILSIVYNYFKCLTNVLSPVVGHIPFNRDGVTTGSVGHSQRCWPPAPVSYTHLTLPTNREV